MGLIGCRGFLEETAEEETDNLEDNVTDGGTVEEEQ
ncbi:unnamed protein product, partial [Brassica rapa]